MRIHDCAYRKEEIQSWWKGPEPHPKPKWRMLLLLRWCAGTQTAEWSWSRNSDENNRPTIFISSRQYTLAYIYICIYCLCSWGGDRATANSKKTVWALRGVIVFGTFHSLLFSAAVHRCCCCCWCLACSGSDFYSWIGYVQWLCRAKMQTSTRLDARWCSARHTTSSSSAKTTVINSTSAQAHDHRRDRCMYSVCARCVCLCVLYNECVFCVWV